MAGTKRAPVREEDYDEPPQKKARTVYLTIGDLKSYLAKFDDNLPLIYASDDEGNEYRFVTSAPSLTNIYKEQRDIDLEIATEATPDTMKCVVIN